MNFKPIATIITGSTLYGTNMPGSDIDTISVVAPYGKDIILQKCQLVEDLKDGDDDHKQMSLQKFFKLLAEGQTIQTDMLFAPKDKWVMYSDIWENIIAQRHKFISKKVAAFVGFCRSQAKRYSLKCNRLGATKQVVEFLRGKMENTREPNITKLRTIREDIVELVKNVNEPEHFILSYDDKNEYMELCQRQINMTCSIKYAWERLKALEDEYGERARAVVGGRYDSKAMYHAVRVMSEAYEIVTTGNLTFPRPEAEYLRKIRTEEVPLKEILEVIDDGMLKIEGALLTSKLPDQPDTDLMDKILADVYFGRAKEFYEGQS